MTQSTTLRQLVPKLFIGIPEDAELEGCAPQSDRLVAYWLLPDGRKAQRSELLRNLPKGMRLRIE